MGSSITVAVMGLPPHVIYDDGDGSVKAGGDVNVVGLFAEKLGFTYK